MKKYSTYFCDIDGTIFKYRKFEMYRDTPPELTPGALDKLLEIKEAGHMVILTTARPESLRPHTEKELWETGVPYDRLVMEIGRGPRHLINDMDPNAPGERATGWNLERNAGLLTVRVDEA